MPSANYPNGFSSGITIRGIPLVQSHPGEVFWVGNGAASGLTGHHGASNGNKGNFRSVFSSLDYAIGRCVANRGDIIFVKPGHAETISSATALAADIAGVAIVGLGIGSLRPTFTFDTATTATIPVSAANVAFKNCIFTANFADIVSVFTLTTAKHLTLEDCVFKATATNMNFLHVVDTNATTADADGLYVSGCKWVEPDAATLAFALVDGTNDGWTFVDNYVNIGGTTTAAALFTVATTKALTNLRVQRNFVQKIGQTDGSAGVLLTSDTTTNSGIVAENYTQNADAAANIIVFATSGISVGPNNYHSGVVNEHGVALSTAFNNS
jgi:hypothetical protein